MCLKINGFALARWTERESTGVGKNRRTRTVTYEGREDYIHSTTYLVGSPDGQQVEILAGLHTFTFSCALPPAVPTSFEGTHGHIRYTVRVGLERPWKFDQTYKVAFTVLK
jgi:Arrestin (or S-antigen), N-terminal domain